MRTLCVVLFALVVLIQVYMGYRTNKLYWKSIYRSTKRLSLRRLKDALNNSQSLDEQLFVQKTINLYYIQLSLIFLLFLCLIISWIKNA